MIRIEKQYIINKWDSSYGWPESINTAKYKLIEGENCLSAYPYLAGWMAFYAAFFLILTELPGGLLRQNEGKKKHFS